MDHSGGVDLPTGEMNSAKRLRTTENDEERWSRGDEESRSEVDVVREQVTLVAYRNSLSTLMNVFAKENDDETVVFFFLFFFYL